MPFSTSRAAVSRCLLALATLLALLLICGPVTTTADAARKRPVAAKKKTASKERFAIVKQRGKAGGRRQAAVGRASLRGTTMGINAGGMMFKGAGPEVAGRLDNLRRAGAAVLRMDASWSYIEPSAPVAGRIRQRFENMDVRVASAVRAGMRPLIMLGFGTPWATPGKEIFAAPTDPADFARYAASVAGRYAPGAPFWEAQGLSAPAGGVLYEIWNEPNAELFLRDQQTAPARFATLLLHAQRAVRAAAPGARISVGGLVPIGAARFLAEALRAEPALRNEIAAVGWHPYERTAEAVVRITRQFRRDVDSMGLAGVPLDITEIGWSQTEIPEPRRSVEFEQTLIGLRAPELGVGLIVPYVALEEGEESYGLWRATGEATASALAFTRVALRGSR